MVVTMKHDDHATISFFKILAMHCWILVCISTDFWISILKNMEAMQSKWTSRRPRLPVSQLQAEAWRKCSQCLMIADNDLRLLGSKQNLTCPPQRHSHDCHNDALSATTSAALHHDGRNALGRRHSTMMCTYLRGVCVILDCRRNRRIRSQPHDVIVNMQIKAFEASRFCAWLNFVSLQPTAAITSSSYPLYDYR